MAHFLAIAAALVALAIGVLCKRALKRRRYLLHVQPAYHRALATADLAILQLDTPPISDFQQDIAAREEAITRLSASINMQLERLLENHREMGREHLAHALVEAVEYLVLERLNRAGYSFGRLDYDGDINCDNSGQTYFNGAETAPGLLLEFRGFSCKVSWFSLENACDI